MDVGICGQESCFRVSPFQHWLDHGLLSVLASLPARSGHVMLMAVANAQLRGNGISHVHSFSSTSLLSVLAVSFHQCSPSFPFWQQENSEAKPVTLPCLEQLPRTGLQLWALNWEQTLNKDHRGEPCFLSQCFLVDSSHLDFPKWKPNFTIPFYRRGTWTGAPQKGWGTGWLLVKVAKGWGN